MKLRIFRKCLESKIEYMKMKKPHKTSKFKGYEVFCLFKKMYGICDLSEKCPSLEVCILEFM